jgi:hypothetical protein
VVCYITHNNAFWDDFGNIPFAVYSNAVNTNVKNAIPELDVKFMLDDFYFSSMIFDAILEYC